MPSDPTASPPPQLATPPASAGGPSPVRPPSRLAKFVGRGSMILVGLYLLIILLLAVYLLLKFWPTDVPVSGKPGETEWLKDEALPFFRHPFQISDEVRVLLIVLAAGAIGSMIHALRSFLTFVGNRQLVWSWVPWYLLRPAVGAVLALVFYLIVRGGLLPTSVSESGLSVSGVAGLAALVGLFSEKALIKLREVFDTLFATREPEKTADQLTAEIPNPKPELSALTPPSVAAGTAGRSVTVIGSNFAAGAEVHVNGQPRETEVRSDTELVFRPAAGDVATPGDKQVTVVNPPPGGGESDPLTLKVTA